MPEITLLNVDCMEYMAGLPDKAFDLAIVDPPYGLNIVANGLMGNRNPFGGKQNLGAKNTRKTIVPSKNYGAKVWDANSPDKEYFDQLFRVSKNQIIWGANHFISKIPFDSPCWIVWDKDRNANYADCEIAWTSFDSPARKFKWRWNGMLQEKMGYDKEERIHPTQKPVGLYKWILQNYANKGDKILDTHGGSRSLAIACYQLGFDHVTCEIDNQYHIESVKRFKEQTAQQKLFI